jgi:hypothetical protein
MKRDVSSVNDYYYNTRFANGPTNAVKELGDVIIEVAYWVQQSLILSISNLRALSHILCASP